MAWISSSRSFWRSAPRQRPALAAPERLTLVAGGVTVVLHDAAGVN